MSNQLEWEQLIKLIEMKKKEPEKYKEFIKDLTGIMIDMKNAVEEAVK